MIGFVLPAPGVNLDREPDAGRRRRRAAPRPVDFVFSWPPAPRPTSPAIIDAELLRWSRSGPSSVDLFRDGIGSPACYRRAGFEFRDSGHVFDHHGQLLGHVAYMKEDCGRDRPILRAWHGWLKQPSSSRDA